MEDDICDVTSKDWLLPACTSLAQLEQVSTSVYNIRLGEPISAIAKNTHQKSQTRSLYDKRAWGSNTSINGLTNQTHETYRQTRKQIVSKPVRPSSAKNYRTAQLTSNKKIRPQSAKNVSHSSRSEIKPPLIAVKGSKYDQNSRPPKRPVHTTVSEGWVGPPAGVKMDDVINIISDSESFIQTDKAKFELCNENIPPPPQATPEPESTLDGFSEVESIVSENEVEAVLQRKPTQESIHLSLPSAGEEEEEGSEWDTERVLQEVQALSLQRQEVTVKYHHQSDLSCHQASMMTDPPASNELVKPMEKPEESHRSRSPSSYNINERTIMLSANTAHREAHLSSKPAHISGTHWDHSRGGSVRICEDKNITFHITPRNRGYRVNNKIARCYSNLQSKTRKMDLTNIKSRVNTGIDVQAVIAEQKSKQSFSTTNTDNCNHLGLEVNAKSVGKKVNMKPSSVPIVMVKYNNEQSDASSSDKPVGHRRKHEVITMVSQFDLSDSEDDRLKERSPEQTNKKESLQTPSAMQLVRSSPVKNYYEVAMRTEQGKKLDDSDNSTDNFLYKTIKTIEFDEIGHSPRESTVKSIIPGTTSVTKPRQKLAVSVDYLGRQRSASLSTQKADKTSILIPGSPQSEKNEKREKSESTEKSGNTVVENKVLYDTNQNRIPRVRKTRHQSKYLSLPSHQKPARRRNIWQCKDNETESISSECTDLSTTTAEPMADEIFDKSHSTSPESTRPNSGISNKSLSRPASCFEASLHRMKSFDTRRIQSAALAAEREHKKYAVYTRSFARRQIMQSPPPLKDVVYLNTKKHPDAESEETLACQEMKDKLAGLGLNIKAETLERALFPPSGKTLHYEMQRDVLRSPAAGLLSHPKFWLPAEYMKLKIAEKQLARAEHTLWLQKKEEEREVKSVLGLTSVNKTKKSKKKRGKTKIKRPASVS
ncbi:uncharacterized protein LOC121382718 [Gigantopelta aegis]|uniref:uncharacterized protein LOC121382718 n=1 Tax=Gigantopelta aegis TaxID=1735272 RepID=UPI001B888039|nr:uncharacterized protein LOC121382718 [Gigantopelta aegis]